MRTFRSTVRGVRTNYSKWLSELEAFSWLARGVEVVAVNPSVVLGAGNVRLDQGTMRAVWDIATGRQRFYPTGGMNVVDVADVVQGHLAAAERGRSGARYILGGENLTHRRMLGMLAEGFGRRAPIVPAPAPLLVAAMAPVEALSRLTGRAPKFTLAHARLSGKFNWFSSARAERELGYRHRPFAETVVAMAADLKSKGVL